jgi:hypothetical protein
MIVRAVSNPDKVTAPEMCGKEQEYFWDVVVFTSEAKSLLISRVCSVYVDGIPLHPDSLYFAEAVEVIIKGRIAFINTPFYRKSVSE